MNKDDLSIGAIDMSIRIMKECLYKNGIDTKNKFLKWTWLEIIRKRL